MQDERADGTLVRAVLDRTLHSDPHDFAGLYIRHRSSFTLHARRYLRDQRDADEVVQEAFLRLFLALPELETELQALAYCRKTITNLCIDRYRAQARRPNLIDLDSVSPDELAEDDLGDPVVRAEDAAVVREALSLLSPLHRAALVKREIEEKSLPVIAAELDIPEESVKHVLFRARRALRRVLAGTSVAPAALGRVAAKSSSTLGALVLLVVFGLSSGPNLSALPVVGDDLPDLPGIGEVARTIVHALSDTSGSGDTPTGDGPGVPSEEVAPLLVAVPTASPSPSAVPLAPVATAASPAPAAATGTVTVDPEPSTAPAPAALPSVAPSATQPPASPTASPSPATSGTPTPAAVGAAATAQPSPASTPERAPTTYRQRKTTSPEPSPAG